MKRRNNPKDHEVQALRNAIDDALDSLRKNRNVEAFEQLREVVEQESDDQNGDDQA